MKLDYGEEDKEIRLSGYDEFLFQDRDAGEVRQEPVLDPAMEVAFNFNEEDEGFPPYPSSNPTVHCNPNPNVRTGDGYESDPGSEAAEEADQEELTQASDVSSESSEEARKTQKQATLNPRMEFRSNLLTLMSPLLGGK